MQSRDIAWLADILDSARLVREFIEGVDYDEFAGNVMRHSAVLRHLEIMGEAAKHVSDAYKVEHPEISWREMAGLRDILIHSYSRVDLATVWRISTRDVLELIRTLEPLVPPIDE